MRKQIGLTVYELKPDVIRKTTLADREHPGRQCSASSFSVLVEGARPAWPPDVSRLRLFSLGNGRLFSGVSTHLPSCHVTSL